MKKAFNECYKAVVACEDETGRKRCELFKDLPDRRVRVFTLLLLSRILTSLRTQDYADYYQVIKTPIALAQLRKRMSTNYYKTVVAFRDDWKLMFENARTYNQEGSWVYIDAEEMEKVFDATFDRVIVGSGLPGAAPAPGGAASSSYESALTPVDDDERPPPSRSRGGGRKQVISDDEYLTPSDED
jgi:ATP-dependent helicase STH1/SNF2